MGYINAIIGREESGMKGLILARYLGLSWRNRARRFRNVLFCYSLIQRKSSSIDPSHSFIWPRIKNYTPLHISVPQCTLSCTSIHQRSNCIVTYIGVKSYDAPHSIWSTTLGVTLLAFSVMYVSVPSLLFTRVTSLRFTGTHGLIRVYFDHSGGGDAPEHSIG